MYGIIGVQLKELYKGYESQIKCYYLPGFTMEDALLLDATLNMNLMDKQESKVLYSFGGIRWLKRRLTYLDTKGQKRLSLCAFGKIKDKILILDLDTTKINFSQDIFNLFINAITQNSDDVISFLKLKKNFFINASSVISTEKKVYESIKGQFLKSSGYDHDLIRASLTSTQYSIGDHIYHNLVFITPGMKRKEMEEYWYTYVIPQNVLIAYSRHETSLKASEYKIEKIFLDILYLLARY